MLAKEMINAIIHFTMNARIRYGNEVDVLGAIARMDCREPDPALETLRPLGRNILSFSMRVYELPELASFPVVMEGLGIEYLDEPEPDDPEPFRSVRFVEIVKPKPLGDFRLRSLADEMTRLAVREGDLGNNGVYFIDHSISPEGVVIAER